MPVIFKKKVVVPEPPRKMGIQKPQVATSASAPPKQVQAHPEPAEGNQEALIASGLVDGNHIPVGMIKVGTRVLMTADLKHPLWKAGDYAAILKSWEAQHEYERPAKNVYQLELERPRVLGKNTCWVYFNQFKKASC